MIRWLAGVAVRNSVAVNLATTATCVGGLMLYLGMPREVFPDFSLGTVTVTTAWPGASPEDVERLVTLPIEDEIEALEGLEEYTSESLEGISRISLVLEDGYDMPTFLEDVRTAVERDLDLPDDSEEPLVDELESEFPAIAVYLYGHASESELRDLAEDVKRDLEGISGVSQAVMAGTREPRVWVEVDPLALERFGLTLDGVGRAVEARSRNAPLGSLTTESGDYLLRVESDVEGAEDLRDLPVVRRPDGTTVRLSQVARVRDTFERASTRVRFMGRPCVRLQVNKKARGDAIDVSRDVFAYMDELQPTLPAGVAIGANSDMSVYVTNRLGVMRSSAALGGLLVLVSLLLFLNVRVALVTALGIPIAFLGGLLVAGAVGITMNMITMFALIVVLGMVVDDAIVVSENVYRLREEGYGPEEAAIEGTAQVGKPVLATILTTIAAFLPVLAIPGVMGEFIAPLPLLVTFCLAASLLEALLVLPSHMAHWTGKKVLASGGNGASSRRWYDPLRDAYTHVLRGAIRWRYAVVAFVLTGTAVLVGAAANRVPFHLFDDFESKVFYINLRATPDASLDETMRRTQPVEDFAMRLPPEELESVNALGGIVFSDANNFTFGQNLSQIWVELREGVPGRRATSEVIEEVRQAFRDPPPGIESVEVDQPQAGPTGRAIDVAVRGPDLAVLEEISSEVQGLLGSYPGIRDVRDDSEEGKREVVVRLRDAGRHLGFDEALLSAELRAAFEGTRYGRIRRGRDDVEVMVKLPEEVRTDRGALAALRVTAPGGARVPLGSVADLDERASRVRISRDDGERAVHVTADVNKEQTTASDVTSRLVADLGDVGARWPGYDVELAGDAEETAESIAGLQAASVIALLLIYLILGTLFRSLSQPLVIMSAIPFGLIGMIGGHLAMGRPLSFMSLIGLLALSGVVVNDSLILVDFVNQRRREGSDLPTALVQAGRQRFRPILLTSITTMLGLTPLTFFASGQARFLQPMAITVFFGLAAGTFLILLVVPCVFGVLEDARAFARHPLQTLGRLARNEVVHPRNPRPEAVP